MAAKLEREGLRPDVVSVDPPRKGLCPLEVIESVAAMGPARWCTFPAIPLRWDGTKRFAQLGVSGRPGPAPWIWVPRHPAWRR